MRRSLLDVNHPDIVIHRFTDRATIDDICDAYDREERKPYMPLKTIWDYRNAIVDFPPGITNMDIFGKFTERLRTLRMGSVAAIVCNNDLQARTLKNVLDKMDINSETEVFTEWNPAYDWLVEHD